MSPMQPWLRDIVLHAMQLSGASLLAAPGSFEEAIRQARDARARLLIVQLDALSSAPTSLLLQAPTGLRILALNSERQGISAYELKVLTRDIGLAELAQLLAPHSPA
ncbi:hypothetical protein H5407_21890 [Mitsuaria sp. WAJ17]|nr:hypothetical protein [Mitsuaria sp. WAJ17]